MQRPYTLTDHYNFLKSNNAFNTLGLENRDYKSEALHSKFLQCIQRLLDYLQEANNYIDEQLSIDYYNQNHSREVLSTAAQYFEFCHERAKEAWFLAYEVSNASILRQMQSEMMTLYHHIRSGFHRVGRTFSENVPTIDKTKEYMKKAMQGVDSIQCSQTLEPQFKINLMEGFLQDITHKISDDIITIWWHALSTNEFKKLRKIREGVQNLRSDQSECENTIRKLLTTLRSHTPSKTNSLYHVPIQLRTNIL